MTALPTFCQRSGCFHWPPMAGHQHSPSRGYPALDSPESVQVRLVYYLQDRVNHLSIGSYPQVSCPISLSPSRRQSPPPKWEAPLTETFGPQDGEGVKRTHDGDPELRATFQKTLMLLACEATQLSGQILQNLEGSSGGMDHTEIRAGEGPVVVPFFVYSYLLTFTGDCPASSLSPKD
jgi:hypothetical protein